MLKTWELLKMGIFRIFCQNSLHQTQSYGERSECIAIHYECLHMLLHTGGPFVQENPSDFTRIPEKYATAGASMLLTD